MVEGEGGHLKRLIEISRLVRVDGLAACLSAFYSEGTASSPTLKSRAASTYLFWRGYGGSGGDVNWGPYADLVLDYFSGHLQDNPWKVTTWP